MLKSKTYCLYPYVTSTSRISSGSRNHKTFWVIFVAIAWKLENVGLSFSRFNRCAQPYHPGSGSRMREGLETEKHIFGGRGAYNRTAKSVSKQATQQCWLKYFLNLIGFFTLQNVVKSWIQFNISKLGGAYIREGEGGGYNRMYFFCFQWGGGGIVTRGSNGVEIFKTSTDHGKLLSIC